MKINFSILFVLLLITGLLSACQTSSTNTISISEQDAGKTIDLKTGDLLEISLNGNITTGFNWVPADQDPVLLEQVGEVEVTPASDQLGAPGVIVLTFKAISQGQTNLRLEYKQPWDENTTPEETFEITVVIN